MRTSQWTPILTSVVVGSLAAACDTGTEPGGESPPFDVGAVLSDYQAMEAALSTEGFAGFRALADRTPFGASAAALTSSAAAAPIISDVHRGVTFVYDPDGDQYVVDWARPGAPAKGVRFITYEVDAAGRPFVDQEIGYADLVDEGDGSVEDVVLHVTLIQGGTTILDYRTAVDDTGNGGSLAVRGFLFCDNIRLDFDIHVVGVREGPRPTLDLTFDLRMDARGFQVGGERSWRGGGEGGRGGHRDQRKAP